MAQSSHIGWAKLSEHEEEAEECDTEHKLQREALDKMDGMICNGFQDAGDDSDSLRARLEQVASQVKQLPERIKSETRAEASDATVARARVDELHGDPLRKLGRDELHDDGMHLAAVVTAAVDAAVTKQLQAVESTMKMIKGHRKRVDAEFVKLKEW